LNKLGCKNPIKEENGVSNGKIVGINRDSFLYDCAVEAIGWIRSWSLKNYPK